MKFNKKDVKEFLAFRQYMAAKEDVEIPCQNSSSAGVSTAKLGRKHSKPGVNIALVLKTIPSKGSITRGEILDALPRLSPMQVDTSLKKLLKLGDIKRIKTGTYELS